MADDFIPRKDLEKWLTAEMASLDTEEDRKYVIERLREEVPAADVAPVRHGWWIPDYDYAEYDFDGCTLLSEPRIFQDGWQRSLCRGYMSSETNYCPNCGALMNMEDTDGETTD